MDCFISPASCVFLLYDQDPQWWVVVNHESIKSPDEYIRNGNSNDQCYSGYQVQPPQVHVDLARVSSLDTRVSCTQPNSGLGSGSTGGGGSGGGSGLATGSAVVTTSGLRRLHHSQQRLDVMPSSASIGLFIHRCPMHCSSPSSGICMRPCTCDPPCNIGSSPSGSCCACSCIPGACCCARGLR